MKLLELISLSKHHANLCGKVGWYSKWHEHPHHKHVHWLTFFIFVLFSGIIVYNSYIFKPDGIRAEKDNEKIAENIEKSVEEKTDKGKKDETIKEDKEDKEAPTIEDVGVPTSPIETSGSVGKKEKDLPAQAGIISIDEVVVFVDELAENIGKIDISGSADAEALTDKEEKSEKEKEEKEKKNENENENGNKNEDENGDDDNNEQDVNDEGNEEENNKQGGDEEDNEKNTETPPVEEIVIPQPEAGPPPAEVIPASDTATVLDVTSPIRNNKYRTGPMPIYVVYSKIVEVNGSPKLVLATGNPSETLIDYKNGSGTNTLVFTYKIASTNFSSDLDCTSVNSLILNEGSIKDLDGNDASIVLPTPGTAHSLSGNKDIKIDTTLHKPTVLHTSVL